ncbi:hypothetical protein [Sutcliffiella deserti]|uniref:hypothetical protein n=1 Tax=Sutcliffiella deserti TaxID=2875501 RepID=UPI001CBEBB2E|nr:hypothetical protein [Sutcliffiella deserti]
MRRPLIGLLKKEWILTKQPFIFTTITFLAGWIISLGFSFYYREPTISLIVSIVILVLHLLYFPIILMFGLIVEGKTQLWLHSTQSTRSLLLSKIVTGIYLQIISFSVFGFVFISIFHIFPSLDFIPYNSILLTESYSLNKSGIEFALNIMFYWAVYHAIGMVGLLGRFKVQIFFLFLIGFQSLIMFLDNTTLINTLSQFGPLPWNYDYALDYLIRTEGASTFHTNNNPFTLGAFIIFLFKSLGWFFLTAWLLEKAVEVK